MFRRSREWAGAILQALQDLASVLATIAQGLDVLSDTTLADRVEGLERSRALWEAEIDANLQRAEGERRAARAAEERVRTRAAKRPPETDEPDGLLEEWVAAGAPSPSANQVDAPAPRSRRERIAIATRRKFGG